MPIDWVGGRAPQDLYFDDYPRPIFRGYSSGCHKNYGTWCPKLLFQNKYHWIEYDQLKMHQDCLNKTCPYKRKNKKDGFRCLYFKCHPKEIKDKYNEKRTSR